MLDGMSPIVQWGVKASTALVAVAVLAWIVVFIAKVSGWVG